MAYTIPTAICKASNNTFRDEAAHLVTECVRTFDRNEYKEG